MTTRNDLTRIGQAGGNAGSATRIRRSERLVMPLIKMLLPVGNSVGMVIDKPILRMLDWDENTWITMRAEGDRIVIRRATDDEVAAVETSSSALPESPR